MAWASFPCQDLSSAGWRKGMSAKRSGTFWAFWRIMRDLYDLRRRPPLIVIENVTGLLYGDNFTGLCEALAALDLQFGALVLDARWFVPQSRPRVFVVAVDARVDCTRLWQQRPRSSPWLPPMCVRAYEALPGRLQRPWRWWSLPRPSAIPPAVDTLIDADIPSAKWQTRKESDRLLAMMTPTHLDKVRAAQQRAGRSIGFLYKRTRANMQRAEVRFDGVAGCLRTPRGGSSRQTLLMVERQWVRSRLLTSREAARLMGVSDSFILPPGYNDGYRAMGDGVAVTVVRWLSAHLLTPLARSAVTLEHGTANSAGQSVDQLSHSRKVTETIAGRWCASIRSPGSKSPKKAIHRKPSGMSDPMSMFW